MRNLHEWNLSYAEARRVQAELAGRVEFVPLEKEPRIIAGLDCAFSGDGQNVLVQRKLDNYCSQPSKSVAGLTLVL